jgi:DNA segregation ATPase FtsK/SpoIIIE-like protein
VSGVDEEAVDDTLGLLSDVLGIVRARNAAGGQHPGVLLLLEELQDVRAAAARDQRDRLDTLLGRIVRMGRAVGVHVTVSTQRPTATTCQPAPAICFPSESR